MPYWGIVLGHSDIAFKIIVKSPSYSRKEPVERMTGVCGHSESWQNVWLEWPGSQGLWTGFWDQDVCPMMF